jgi:UDP-2,3-diacylglucosamine hydrolase
MSRPARLLLIADLHLEEARPDLTAGFLTFLDHEAPNAQALYILGDLFNVWIGDDDDRPLRATVTAALKRHADQGLAVYLMHGNRDFLLGPAFARESGATLLAEPHLLQHQGQRYLLLHGDVLCTRDIDYMNFRAMVRNPLWQQQFLARPLSERRAFAEQARARSKTMNSNKAADIMDVTPDEVERVLREHNMTTMIHGHTHRPHDHHWQHNGQSLRRLVLGDWGQQLWYVSIDQQSQLVEQPLAG